MVNTLHFKVFGLWLVDGGLDHVALLPRVWRHGIWWVGRGARFPHRINYSRMGPTLEQEKEDTDQCDDAWNGNAAKDNKAKDESVECDGYHPSPQPHCQTK